MTIGELGVLGGLVFSTVATVLSVLTYRRTGRTRQAVTDVHNEVQAVKVEVDGHLSRMLELMTDNATMRGEKAGIALGAESERTHGAEVAAALATAPLALAIPTETQPVIEAASEDGEKIVGTFEGVQKKP